MPNVYEVKAALKQGDRKTATQLLKQVLSSNPSAEAWFVAAQMANDKDLKIKHLNRGLALDPNHRPSKNMLSELGARQQSATSTLLDEIAAVSSNNKTGNKLPLMQNPRVRLALAGLALFIVIVACGTIVMNMAVAAMRPSNYVAVTPGSSITYNVPALDTFKETFSNPPFALIGIQTGNAPKDTKPKNVLTINLRDAAGQPQVVNLYFYSNENDPLVRQLNADYIATYEKMDNDHYDVQRGYNAVLVYPANMDAVTKTALQDVFKALAFPPGFAANSSSSS